MMVGKGMEEEEVEVEVERGRGGELVWWRGGEVGR